ncbi:hypothetical protein, partial [Bradyrhizobium sp. MOS001]|uniref:hypothetical protein n=1 Tax=Bradyrhizobium sp. MOS001 TaxID=2133948 RepID=UPI0019616290
PVIGRSDARHRPPATIGDHGRVPTYPFAHTQDPKPTGSNSWRFPQGSSQRGDCASAAQELNVDWLLIW